MVIWRNNYTPELKYSHNDLVQCLAFNPLTSQVSIYSYLANKTKKIIKLFSGGAVDFALWTPEIQNVDKTKYLNRIICCSWMPDGQLLAFGTFNGSISIRDRKMNEKVLTHQIKKKQYNLSF